MALPTTRRIWLAGLGGLAVTHVVGCAGRAANGAVGLSTPGADGGPRDAEQDADVRPLDEHVADDRVGPSPVASSSAPPPLPSELRLPPRSAGAETGSAFIERIEGLGRAAIDEEVVAAITAGNVPSFERRLLPITVGGDGAPSAVLHVMCDYLAIGSDEDFMRMPMTSAAAQRLCDLLDASLPTKKLVDVIYAQATAKLPPSYIDGGPTEGTLADFTFHQKTLEERRHARGFALGALTAGHKKDLVLSARMVERPGHVAIYGWHRREGDPIQPLSCTHSCRYADYSHGVRLVAEAMTIDDQPHRVSDVLVDPELADLLSDEGPLPMVAYPTELPEYTGPARGSKPKKRSRS